MRIGRLGLLAVLVAAFSLPVLAQVPPPKPQSAPKKSEAKAAKPIPSASLLIVADEACEVEVNGKSSGRLEAGGKLVVPLAALGKQFVEVRTSDGFAWTAIVEITKAGQEIVQTQLGRVRAEENQRRAEFERKRLAAENAAAEKAAAEKAAAEKAAAERTAAEKAAAKKDAEEKAAAERRASEYKQEMDAAEKARNSTVSRGNLMWQGGDNGQEVSQEAAAAYCEGLTIGGYDDWRMPTINELEGIYDRQSNQLTKVYAPIRLTSIHLMSSTTRSHGYYIAHFSFFDPSPGKPGRRWLATTYGGDRGRVLCVRRTRE